MCYQAELSVYSACMKQPVSSAGVVSQLISIFADAKSPATTGAAAAAWHPMPQRQCRQRQHPGALFHLRTVAFM